MTELTVLHEDARMIAVAKPSGMLTIPGRKEKSEHPAKADIPAGYWQDCLLKAVGKRLQAKVLVVHRLDRGASGIVLFAKDPQTHRALCLQFENRQVKKTYLAVVQGQVERAGIIDKPLHRFGSGRMGVDAQGKPSVTRYRISKRFANATLLEAQPITGRRHQIRVHLYSIGHPILGDNRYGKDRSVGLAQAVHLSPGPSELPASRGNAPRLMLHAWKLDVLDLNGHPLHLEAEPPPDFTDFINQFKPQETLKTRP